MTIMRMVATFLCRTPPPSPPPSSQPPPKPPIRRSAAMPLAASLLPRASTSRLAAAASAAALSRLPARAMRRRMAPTPALNDERIKQENEAMRERLRDAKSRVRALMNENQPVATGTSAPARPPAPAATRSNTTTRAPSTPTAAANPSVSARAVRRMPLTPVVANQHLPRANQQPTRPRNRLAPVNEDNNNIRARTLANQNERGHPSTRATRRRPSERSTNQQNPLVTNESSRIRSQAVTRTSVSANANNADRSNASAGTRANVARVGNGPRQGPSAIAATQRPSATRARAPVRPTPMRATPGRAQSQAQVQAATPPNASPSRRGRVRHQAPSRAAAATPTTTPVPARAYVPRPRRHVTPTLNDPKIKQANVELRQRILEAKPIAKASVGFPEPRPQLQPFQSDANGHMATLQVNIETNIHFVTPDASPQSDRQSVHREEDEETQSHLEGDMEHNLITHPEAEIVAVDAHLAELPATPASVTETSPLTLDDINIFDEAFGEGSFGKVHLANVKTTITSFRSILGHQEMVNANPREPTMMAIKVMKLMRKRDGHDENMNTNAREGRSDDTSTSTTGSIRAHGLLDPALAERDALLAIPPHPMVIRLHAAIQDQPTNKLYLLTELGWRGDLRYLQFRQPRRAFKEQDARVYAASIALGLQHIHASNYVHRDIKPDNIVIGEDKRPKIIDFGLAKRLEPGERTTDRCGTLSYSAPEILLAKEEEEEADRRRRRQLDPSAYQTNHGYGNNYGLDNSIDTPNESRGFNKAIDWWAYGAMLYEMLVGRPPFRSQHPDPTYAKQLTEDSLKRYGQGLVELPFPGFVSSDARNLLEQLLARDPETRLGMNGDDELRSHPWFKDIDWSALLTGQFPQLECVF